MPDVAEKLWSYCHVLRHDGVDYADYIEQLSYLLFLKMAAEREIKLPYLISWSALRLATAANVSDVYQMALKQMSANPGVLGEIFIDAQNRITSPRSLMRLISLIDEIHWTSLGVDVQAATFEGLLERAASEGKKGAGQYFTPRPLIDSIVSCLRPDPSFTDSFKIIDPACGTAGFLASAYSWFSKQFHQELPSETWKRVRERTYYGVDLVGRPRRLALMNMYLHGVSASIRLGDSIYEEPSSERFDVVLTNPPFGSQGAYGIPDRTDFILKTTNKQLNFLQHAITLLKPHGQAAIVVPDNVLFSAQATELLDVLSRSCRFHTILRCPNGSFTPYTQGTKTNVLFISRGEATDYTWIYDGRTGVPAISRRNPLTRGHFQDFEKCYGADPAGKVGRSETDGSQGRWRRFSIDYLQKYRFRVDSFRWLREDTFSEPSRPAEIIADAIDTLNSAAEDLRKLHTELSEGWDNA
jgi:type I restriction enzyme M protein